MISQCIFFQLELVKIAKNPHPIDNVMWDSTMLCITLLCLFKFNIFFLSQVEKNIVKSWSDPWHLENDIPAITLRLNKMK